MKLIDEILYNINQYTKCYFNNNSIKEDIIYDLYEITNILNIFEEKIKFLKIQITNYKYIKHKDYLILLNNLSYYTNKYNKYTDKYNLKKKELKKYTKLIEYYSNEIKINNENLKNLKKKEEYNKKNFLYVNLFKRGI